MAGMDGEQRREAVTERLRRAIEARRDELVELITRLVRQPSLPG
jgi:acyl-CoA reductase-like NAD-dependent aldehyde dehydrogenase